jgi:Secretion system C-terminal sorting domain
MIALNGMNNNTIIYTFPNPVTDFMTVQLPSAAELRVISVEGKLLKTIPTQGSVSLDKADYGEGIFFLQIIQNGEAVTKKISCNYLVVTRYSGFGTRNLDILCSKLSKTPVIAFRIPNSQSRLSNYNWF